MDYIALGRTNLRVSRICFGCAAIGGYDYGPVDDQVSIRAIQRAVELGVNFFDVADVYGFGRAERVLNAALGSKINDVVIATKFGVRWGKDGKTDRDASPEYLKRSLEESLLRLGCNAIPLYQLHWPDSRTKLEDTISTMEDCRREGKLMHLGVCNLDLEQVVACQRSGRVESLQVPYSLVDRQNEELIENVVIHHGMTAMVYNALGHGLLSGKYGPDSVFSGTDLRTRVRLFQSANLKPALCMVERIRMVAERNNRSCTQVALNWLLAQPRVGVAIVGTKTVQQIEDSAAAAGWKLEQDETLALSS